MSYYVNRSDGNIAAVVEDGTLNTQTTLKLIGVGYANYAEAIAENFVDLMESFAGYNPPANPIEGQLWYNKSLLQMQVFDGDVFLPVNNVKISSATPTNSNPGDFWYNSDDMQLLYLRGDQWQVIAPPYKQSQGRSEVVVETLYELNGTDHTATVVYASGLPILIISSDSRYQPHPYIEGYNWINPGINIPSYAQTQNGIFWGGNGNAYSSSGITVGGSTGQLQFNNSGFFGGATGLTTNGINLQSTGTISATTVTGATLTSTISGVRFPDNTVQTTAVTTNPNVLTGNGAVYQVPYFNSTKNLTSSGSITTDGTDLTMVNGTLFVKDVYMLPNPASQGITFSDGSVQTTAAFNNTGTVNGTGTAGQFAYFNSIDTVTSTTSITTNGVDLTAAAGTLTARNLRLTSAQSGSLTFQDGTVQTTAFNTNVLSGTSGQLTYFNGTNTVRGTDSISTNGTDLTVTGEVSTRDLTVTGNFNQLVGSQNAKVYIGDTSTYLSHSYASTINLPSSLSFVVKGSNFVTLSDRVDTGKRVELSYPLVFPDGSIQTTAPTIYTLPTASSSTLGGVKVGSGLSINSGTLSTVFNDPGLGGIGSYTLAPATGLSLGDIATKSISTTGYYDPNQTFFPGPIGGQWRKMSSASQNVNLEAGAFTITFDLWLRIA